MRFAYTCLLVPFALLSAVSAQSSDDSTLACFGTCLKNEAVSHPDDVKTCAANVTSSTANATEVAQCVCNSNAIITNIRPCVTNCSSGAWKLLQKTCSAIGANVPDDNAAAVISRGSVLVFATAALALAVVV